MRRTLTALAVAALAWQAAVVVPAANPAAQEAAAGGLQGTVRGPTCRASSTR